MLPVNVIVLSLSPFPSLLIVFLCCAHSSGPPMPPPPPPSLSVFGLFFLSPCLFCWGAIRQIRILLDIISISTGKKTVKIDYCGFCKHPTLVDLPPELSPPPFPFCPWSHYQTQERQQRREAPSLPCGQKNQKRPSSGGEWTRTVGGKKPFPSPRRHSRITCGKFCFKWSDLESISILINFSNLPSSVESPS